MIDVPADLRLGLDRFHGAIDALLDLFARQAVLILPGENFGKSDQDAEKRGEGSLGGFALAVHHRLGEVIECFETLAGAAGVDAVRMAAGYAVFAETRGRVVVPRKNYVHQRSLALRTPLQAVERVRPEEILGGGVPPGAVFGVVPTRDAC